MDLKTNIRLKKRRKNRSLIGGAVLILVVGIIVVLFLKVPIRLIPEKETSNFYESLSDTLRFGETYFDSYSRISFQVVKEVKNSPGEVEIGIHSPLVEGGSGTKFLKGIKGSTWTRKAIAGYQNGTASYKIYLTYLVIEKRKYQVAIVRIK